MGRFTDRLFWTEENQAKIDDRFLRAREPQFVSGLPPVDANDWRVTVEFFDPPPEAVLAQLAATAGDRSPDNVHSHKTSFYSTDEAMARAAFDEAVAQVGFRHLHIERWNPSSGQWLTVADAGTRPGPANRQTRSSSQRLWFAAFVLSLDLIVGAFLYFVPGMQFSPQAGHTHNLGRTIGLIVLGDVAMVFIYARKARP